MKQSELYITITGFKNYYDKAPLRIGNLIRCSKELDNPEFRKADKRSPTTRRALVIC